MRNNNDETSWRTLHVIDLENLAGSPRASRDQVRATIRSYCHSVAVDARDHAVIAMNAKNGDMSFTARDEWRDIAGCGCVIKVGHGTDGADDALLSACDPQRIAARYGHVVIGSGDHKFADLIIDLRASGTDVEVVSRHRSLSKALATIALACHYLDERLPNAA